MTGPSGPRSEHRRPFAVAGAGAALLLVALTFDTGPLIIPGVAFLVLGIVLPLAVRAVAAGSAVERLTGETETVEGARYRSAVTVTAGPFGVIGAELRDPMAGEPARVLIGPSPRRRRTVRFEVVTTFPRRGLVRLALPVLALSDPLGLERVERLAPAGAEVLVLPAVSEVHWRATGGREHARSETDGARAEALAAVEVDGLRPYRAGTPASRIHWPALARGAGLLERRMRAEEDPRPLVVLDTRCRSGDPADLDAPVRAAASLVFALARRGGCGLLVGEDARVLEVDGRLAGWGAARRRLALAEPTDRAPSSAAARSAGHLLYVTADPRGRPPQALRASGGVLVRPAGSRETTAATGAGGATAGDPAPRPPGAAGVVLEVAGCVGFTLARRRTIARPAPEPSVSA